MLEGIDLRRLAELRGPERAFLSFYAAGEPGIQSLDDRAQRIRAMLSDAPAELEHFEHSLELLRTALPTDGADTNGGLAIFSCWALDYCVRFPLSVPPRRDLLRVEAAPYIRPLAELKDEYEPFLVLTADNRQARIYQVISAHSSEEERVKGDVKNHVKKGGWSQKRYQRRRKNELLHYAKEVVEQLESLSAEGSFDRIVLLGQPEALGEIKAAMPPALAERIAGERNIDLGGDEDAMLSAAFDLYTEQERRDEAALWDRIRGEYCADGLAATGARDVLAAALEGRVDTMIVTRDADVRGMRCRDCELVAVAQPQQCPRCRSTSVFEVDLIEELVHQLEKTGADVEFCDPIEGLTELGDLAALLRW